MRGCVGGKLIINYEIKCGGLEVWDGVKLQNVYMFHLQLIKLNLEQLNIYR
jgi:hypothetical protein